jgi:predicted DNA-binding transcriptional regulator
VVSEKSTRGKIVGLIGDGVPWSVSRIAAELGVEVRSVFWACYDLYRLGLVLRSAEPVGVLSLEFVGGQVKRLGEFAYLAASDEVSKEIVVDGGRYVRSQFADSPAGVRSSSSYGETVRSQVMRLLDDGQPRAIRQLAQELGMSEERVYNSVYLLYKCGAVLRTEKAQAQESARRWEKKPAHHLWTVSPDGEKDTIIAGQKYVGHRKRNGKTISQQIIGYVREHLHDKAAFTTQLRKDLEKQLGASVLQSMVMCVLSKHRREVYIRGYQGAERMTPFAEGFAVTWLDPNLPREQGLVEAKERTDKFLQGE